MNQPVNSQAPSVQALAQARVLMQQNWLETANRPTFSQTVAGRMMQEARADVAKPVETQTVPPQYGAGSLGALAALGSVLQGPGAVTRQGERIARSAAERRQVQQYNAQRIDAQRQNMTAMDMAIAQQEDMHFRANRDAELAALNQLQSALVAEAGEAQRLAERAEATEEDRRRWEATQGLDKKYKEYLIRSDKIHKKHQREMDKENLTLAQLQAANEARESELRQLRMELQLGDPILAAMTDEQKAAFSEANMIAHQVATKWAAPLDGGQVLDSQQQERFGAFVDQTQLPEYMRKMREDILDAIGGFDTAIGNEAALNGLVEKHVNRNVRRVVDRAQRGQINTLDRVDVERKKGESQGDYEIRRERTELLAHARLPQAMERLSAMLVEYGRDVPADQLLETMPPKLRDAWLEADATGQALDQKVAADHREWFENNQLPVPGEKPPVGLSKESTGFFQEPLTVPGEYFELRNGRVQYRPSKAVGEDFPTDVMNAGRAVLSDAARRAFNAPKQVDPFADKELLDDFLNLSAKLTTDLFFESPETFGVEDILTAETDARESVLRNQASNVQ